MVTETFEETLSRYKGLLFTLCRRFSRRGLDVDDIMQEMSVALWQHRDKLMGFSHRAQQAAWVWRVASNAAIDTLRQHRVHEQLPERWEQPSEDRSQIDALHELIAMLPDDERTLVELQLQGYSYQEIAAKMNISEKNVSVRLVRIKNKLRKGLTT